MVSKDPQKAVSFYRKAVELGHHKAMVNLGVALYTGTGCDKDPAAAEKLWIQASHAGVDQADLCLRNMEKSPGAMEKMFK